MKKVVAGIAIVAIGVTSSQVAFAQQRKPKPQPSQPQPPPQPPAPKEDARFEEAREAVRRGLAAAARGDNENAVAEYRHAHELVPDANIPYRLEAEALVPLGRYDEAIAAYEKYLAIKSDVSDRDRVRARIDELAARRSAIASVASDPPGATVHLDGAPTSSCTTPCEVSLTPGDHRLVLRAAGRIDGVLSVKATPAARVQLFAPLVLAGTDATNGNNNNNNNGRDEPPSKGIGTRRTIGLIVGGAGLAALGTAGAMDILWVRSRIDAFEGERSRGGPNANGAFEDASTAQTVTLVTAIAGGVLTLAGAALFLWPSGSRSSSASSLADHTHRQ